MKRLKRLLIPLMLLVFSSSQAQVRVNININPPPPWGPVGYYGVRYYYLPDLEMYYDIQTRMFIYYIGGTWIYRSSLPARYRGYDLYRGYKVVVNDYHGNAPYMYFKDHKTKYYKGYRGQPPKNIGQGPRNVYNKPPPQHANPSRNNHYPVGHPINPGHNNMKRAPERGGGHNKK